VFGNGFHLPQRTPGGRPFIVDLGANVGYTATHFCRLYPSAQVVAVEMDRANAALARENTAEFRNRCEIVNAAIWSEDGYLFYAGAEKQGYRISELASPEQPCAGRVAAMCMNSLFAKYEIEHVDYLKMDIEGAEDRVLRGDVTWLERVSTMKIELHPPATYDACSGILNKAGFRCLPDAKHSHCISAFRISRGKM
jgi:FkbM family methyltransferase